jgi:hypothetical protein
VEISLHEGQYRRLFRAAGKNLAVGFFGLCRGGGAELFASAMGAEEFFGVEPKKVPLSAWNR